MKCIWCADTILIAVNYLTLTLIKGRHEPVYDTLQCIAQHAKSLPEQIRKLLKASAYSNEALEAIQSIVLNDRTLKSLVGTTQAVDLIHGGVKSNALPEQAWAVVNHRISVVRFVDSRSTSSERIYTIV
jgi:Gly-Xaa carboxypeptidase